jgi:neutral ceramidase
LIKAAEVKVLDHVNSEPAASQPTVMKFVSCRWLWLHLASLVFLSCACSLTNRVHAADATALKAGAAEIDITPPAGHRMAGYFDERLATGTHDPLKAKALVLRHGREEIALVFCDLVGLSLHVTRKARAEASAKTGIPVTNIMIAATHSHTGPLFDDTRRNYFHQLAIEKEGKDPTETIYYPDFLTERLVKVIGQAHENLRAASIETGITQQENLTFNRRYWMKNGKVAFNPGQLNPNIVRPAGPTDTDVGMLMVRDSESSKPFAGLTVFAMHLDTVGGTQYSADYAFFLQETLRKQYGEKFISAFGAGTCGDLNHINVNKKETFKGFEMAERIGSRLGQAVLAASEHLDKLTEPALAVRDRVIEAELQTYTPEQLADAKTKVTKLGDPNTDFTTKVVAVKILDLASRGASVPMEVQVFRLDAETAIVCLPAEIFVELGLAIKKASPFKKTIVISICNDRPSYVPTKKAFSEGSYEVTNSRVKPGTGEQLVDTAVALLNEVKIAR